MSVLVIVPKTGVIPTNVSLVRYLIFFCTRVGTRAMGLREGRGGGGEPNYKNKIINDLKFPLLLCIYLKHFF